ncbi:MAG TPA: ferrochelatase [Polyangiaceae bacterium]|jgi:ferrochelatase|nr:ferrochelatase [Polyangiaceae bacterium]
MTQAVLLAAHGTVDDLNDLGAFVTNVRRGHPPAPELLRELRRRYEAIGGGSPLNAINAEVARKLQDRLRVRIAWANRLWRPYVHDVLAGLARDGVHRVALIPLAQHSAHVYEADARPSAQVARIELACAANWGQSPALRDAFAARVVQALGTLPEVGGTTVIMTAHSLPRSAIDAGDPYEGEVHTAAGAIAQAVRERTANRANFAVAFQSQGLAGAAGPMEWLGPDLSTTLDSVQARGDRHVVVAPIGFLADHVEILYDLDIEVRSMARERQLSYVRAASLNADDDLIEALAEVARPLLSHG